MLSPGLSLSTVPSVHSPLLKPVSPGWFISQVSRTAITCETHWKSEKHTSLLSQTLSRKNRNSPSFPRIATPRTENTTHTLPTKPDTPACSSFGYLAEKSASVPSAVTGGVLLQSSAFHPVRRHQVHAL